jgi:hypothetical protein
MLELLRRELLISLSFGQNIELSSKDRRPIYNMSSPLGVKLGS